MEGGKRKTTHAKGEGMRKRWEGVGRWKKIQAKKRREMKKRWRSG